MKIRSRMAFITGCMWLIPIIPAIEWLSLAGFYEGMIPFLLIVFNIGLFTFIAFEDDE